jgi:hypothetical protein
MKRKPLIVAALVIAAIAVGGTAAAYWTRIGSGTGAAGTGSTSAVTITPGTASAGLFPGGTSSVAVTVTNPNTASVRIDAFSLDTTQGTSGFSVDAGHSGCTLGSLSFPTQTQAGGWTVSGSGNLAVTLPASLTLATTAPNACQGATFTVYLKAGS